MKRLTAHPVVADELRDIRDYYRAVRRDLPARFRLAYAEAVRRVRTHPELYAADDGGFRVAPIDGFPYHIVYADLPTYIWLVCVSHESRRPGHWAARRPDDA